MAGAGLMEWALLSTSLPTLAFSAKLTELGLTVYCPTMMVKRGRQGRRKHPAEERAPAYPGYIFVAQPSVRDLLRTKLTKYSFVRFGDHYAYVDGEEIERLRELERGWSVELANDAPPPLTLRAGARVMIEEGLFSGRIGKVIGFNRYVATIEVEGITLKIRPFLLRLLDF